MIKLTDQLEPQDRIKYILLIIFLIMAFICSAQSVGVYADPKLTLFGDSDHGLDPGTTAVTVLVRLEGNEQKYGRMYLAPHFNFTDLTESDYIRYGVDGGYIWNTPLQDFELLTGVGIGAINRFNGSFLSFNLTGGVFYNIGRFRAGAMFILIDRSDLEHRWNDGGLRPNLEIGIEFNLMN